MCVLCMVGRYLDSDNICTIRLKAKAGNNLLKKAKDSIISNVFDMN